MHMVNSLSLPLLQVRSRVDYSVWLSWQNRYLLVLLSRWSFSTVYWLFISDTFRTPSRFFFFRLRHIPNFTKSVSRNFSTTGCIHQGEGNIIPIGEREEDKRQKVTAP